MIGWQNVETRNAHKNMQKNIFFYILCNTHVWWWYVEYVVSVAPQPEDDKNDQWMGVSVVSQATDDGKALVGCLNVIPCHSFVIFV